MTKFLYLLPLSVLLFSCGNDKNEHFTLSGTLKNATAGDMLYLEELAPGSKATIDSTAIDDKGYFIFKNAQPEPGFYRIKANEQNFAMLVLNKENKVVLNADYKNIGNTYTAEGSADTKSFLEFNTLGKQLQQQTDSMQRSFQALIGTIGMDSIKTDSLSKVIGDIYNKIVDAYQIKFSALVEKNKNSLAVLAGIQQLDPNKYLSLYKEVAASLEKNYPNSKYLINLKRDILAFEAQKAKAATLSVGNAPQDFTMPTPEGKQLSLASFKGKVLLVDFWASWCGPCRKENPNVVAMYKKYHSKGFEILSVSLDEDKDKWLNAVKSDGLTWNHVSDLKGWDNQAAKMYGIESIPFTMLLDKEGKVVAKGLRGAELEAAVVAALSKK
ncbi:MAG: AhpC/TSA family protein [Bacteroidetes bacterium]|nr:AhpC/TSA family protein [Bacteroidota bacterium]